MAHILSGAALFVALTTVAMAILAGLLMLAGYGGLALDRNSDLLILALVSAVAFGTSVTLAILAWRGRHQPLSDGVLAINVLLTLLALAPILFAAITDRLMDQTDLPPLFFSIFYLAGFALAGLVPAHFVVVLALGRTRLLRGLAPPPKTKGPAEASP